jgi:hypothetical protein
MHNVVIQCPCGATTQAQVDECGYVNCAMRQDQALESLKDKFESDDNLMNVLKRLADR